MPQMIHGKGMVHNKALVRPILTARAPQIRLEKAESPPSTKLTIE